MLKQRGFQQMLCRFLSVIFIMASLQNTALAAMVTTEQLATEAQVQQQRNEIKQIFAREDVRQGLMAKGVDPQAAQARVDSMTSEEVAQLHGKLDQLPTGEGTLEVVLIIALIVVILEVTGVTDMIDAI